MVGGEREIKRRINEEEEEESVVPFDLSKGYQNNTFALWIIVVHDPSTYLMQSIPTCLWIVITSHLRSKKNVPKTMKKLMIDVNNINETT